MVIEYHVTIDAVYNDNSEDESDSGKMEINQF